MESGQGQKEGYQKKSNRGNRGQKNIEDIGALTKIIIITKIMGADILLNFNYKINIIILICNNKCFIIQKCIFVQNIEI